MQNELNQYLEKAKADYRLWNSMSSDQSEGAKAIREKMAAEYDAGLRIEEGKVYYKVIQGTSVHSFIVKEDGPKFRKGDILKAAGWNAPAKNRARGNIFGEYRIRWTGAEYLR